MPPGIQDMAVSPDNNYVAVSTRQKYVYIFKLESRTPLLLVQVAKVVLSRVSNRIRFTADSRQLVVADKTGDCFLWKFQDSSSADGTGLVPVCGHLSMVMDVFFNEDQSALITCDRDEKIRVTAYPDTHNLLAYCMGHREYVSQVELMPHNTNWLVSISGDQTVRVWDYRVGKELFQLPLAGPGAYMACWKSDEQTSVIACNIYQSNVLQVFEVQTNATQDGLKMKSMKQVEVSPHTHFKALAHHAGALFTLTMNKAAEAAEGLVKMVPQLDKLEYNVDERTYTAVDLSKVNELLRAELSDLDTEDRDDVAMLFKKRVNNIMHYHEKKRQRIEERSK